LPNVSPLRRPFRPEPWVGCAYQWSAGGAALAFFAISEFGTAPLALLYSGFRAHGSKPAAFHRGLTFSKRAYGPQVSTAFRGVFPQPFSPLRLRSIHRKTLASG
jgi:hypothetical protein